MDRLEYQTAYLKVRLELIDSIKPSGLKREKIILDFIKFLRDQKFEKDGVRILVADVE